MDRREQKTILINISFVFCLILMVAVLSIFWPKYEERFFEFGLLGKNKKAEGYFRNNNSTVEVGSQIIWYIYVHNHMGSSQNVSIRIKFINSTMEMPNDREHQSCPYPSLTEFPVTLSPDDTLFIPFSWIISNAIYDNGSTIIQNFIINDEMFEVNDLSSRDNLFGIVFELWVYDKPYHTYRFGWWSENEFYSSSLNIWFRISLPTG